MAKGIVCDGCGEFEKGEGYLVKIYKNTSRRGTNGVREPLFYKVLSLDDVCTDCVYKITDILGVSREDIEARVREWENGRKERSDGFLR